MAAMAIKDGLLFEFDHEMGTTRRLLERVPDAELSWAPHEKSSTLRKLAAHIATIPHWVPAVCDGSGLDFAASNLDRPKEPESAAAVLKLFDEHVKAARAKIAEQTDGALAAIWTLRNGEHEIFSLPKAAVLRGFIMNHLIHHRGQLSVYLRLRNVPLPSIYGPTADEP